MADIDIFDETEEERRENDSENGHYTSYGYEGTVYGREMEFASDREYFEY
ncbi:MAG: hypothetical protein IJS94_01090 [Clostridia bacterium]|nr:hypothetical protein [Clostridia bacterium]